MRQDLESTTLLDPVIPLFVDGSCYRDYDGNHAGYAVIKQTGPDCFETVKAKQFLRPCLARKAELKALIKACTLAKDKIANIYTDSAYAHGVCHVFGTVWKQKGYEKTDGSPIHHLTLIT